MNRKITILLSLLFMGFYFPSMGQAPITGPTSVCVGTSITVSDTDPAGTWSSSSTTIATIDPTGGVVYGVSSGNTVITYASTAGVSTATITVGPPAITGSTFTVCVNTVITLNDAGTPGNWSTSNSNIATIDASGNLTGVRTGAVTVTFTNTCGTTTSSATVDSFPHNITGPVNVCQGNVIILSDINPGGSWSTSNAAIAGVNVNTGVVSGGGTGGLVTITYTTSCGAVFYNVTNTLATAPIAGTVTSVCAGYTITLTDPTPSGTWSASNTDVTVSGGVVFGNVTGATTISYSNGCGTATYNITINQTPTAITGLNSFCFTSNALFTSTPAGGTWSIDNTAIGTIVTGSGAFTASSSAGSATISYTLGDGCYAVLPITNTNCPACPPNSNFELGNYTIWHYYVGTCCPLNFPTTCSVPPSTAPCSIPCDFALTGPVGAPAPVVATGVDPWGGFPVVGDGVYSLRIGSDRTAQHAEKAVYYVHLPPVTSGGSASYALIYRYAVVLEDPGHTAAQQPRFVVQAFDSNTSLTVPLACANFNYVAGALPGFVGSVSNTFAAAPAAMYCYNHAINAATRDVYYKPWATTSINLTGLGGHTIVMAFEAGDCALGGHFGYGYVDMTCGTFAISSVGCGDSIATVSAPSGFANYTWYDSATFHILYGTTQTVTFPMPGGPTTYAVIMAPYAGFGCPDTLYTTISPSNLQLHPFPDTTICSGQSAMLSTGATDVALPLSYSWSPSTGLNCTTCATPIANPFAGTTTYNVTVTDIAGCSKSTTQTVTVDSVAGVIANTPTSCFGVSDGTATVTPTSGSGGYTYVWSTVPAQTSSVATGLAIGTYVLTITDSKGCTNTESTTIIQPPILADAIGGTTNPTTCGGSDGTITLTGLGAGPTYTVHFLYTATGATTTITAVQTYSVSPTGVLVITGFPISGTVTNGMFQGTYDSITITSSVCPYNELGPIVLSDPPNPALPFVSSNSPICVGSDLNLTTSDVTPGVTYDWSGPNAFTSTSQAPVRTAAGFNDSGYYVVTVTVNNCSSKDSAMVIINAIPSPIDSNSGPICSGDTLKLYTRPNGMDVYLWNGPNGFVSNLQNPIILNTTAAAGGTYTVMVSYKGCPNIDSTLVVVNQTPSAPIVTDTGYCQNNFPPSFLAPALTATGTNLLWYTSMTSTFGASVAPTPITSAVGTTTWYVTQTSATTPPCTSPRAPISVIIAQLPHPQFVLSDSVYCEGTYFTFDISGANTGTDYQGLTWYFGADSIQNVNPILHAFPSPGPVIVTANIYYAICPDTTLSHNVMVFGYPLIHLGNDTSICPGGEMIVIGDYDNNTNPLATWLWSTGEVTDHINITTPGTYYGKVTINGCSTTDTITVANDCYMNIPNVFTPNGDGVNDYFYPRQYLTKGLTSFSMNIYNRWGQLVFTSTSIDGRGWDGSFNSVPQPEGVFVYIIDATFKDGQKEHHQGNITLLR